MIKCTYNMAEYYILLVKEYHSITTINDQKHELPQYMSKIMVIPCYFVYNIIMQQPSTPNTMSLDIYYSNMMVYMIDIYHSTKWLFLCIQLTKYCNDKCPKHDITIVHVQKIG